MQLTISDEDAKAVKEQLLAAVKDQEDFNRAAAHLPCQHLRDEALKKLRHLAALFETAR